ncbi:MAG: uL15 family ribosomal protein [Candidatus Asgardarchaeia archaeon]
MIHRRKKVRKMRGSRTHGYGRVSQHRKSGQRGGYGRAGGHKHFWTYIVKYAPDYFGKHGFHRPPELVKAPYTINVGVLDQIADKLVSEGKAKIVNGVIKINLEDIEIEKLLGSGRVTHKFDITVDYATPKAIQKIESAGGSITVLNQPEEDESEFEEVNEE